MAGSDSEPIVLYAHAGSGNHGCEALANTICKLIERPVRLITNSVAEDEAYSLKGLCKIVPEKRMEDHLLPHILYYGWRLVTGDRESFLRYRFRNIIGKHACRWYISIGGDNYCYDTMVEDLMLTNAMLNRQGGKTILLGCSIEPELLKREDIRRDMARYQAIFARESITYEALLEAGLADRTFLYPDTAFLLKPNRLPLPEGFWENNTVGINLSPMIMENEATSGITEANYKALIQYILSNTRMSVALIPHVVWERNDDRKAIARLYEDFRQEKRVVCIPDGSCEELKGYIGRCRLFVGARTHATIAAYSSGVPTLVVGYSVKARGIAKDLFGTWENYVLPVQQLEKEGQLTEAFRWLLEHEDDVRQRLRDVMPAYRERAEGLREKLEAIFAEKTE